MCLVDFALPADHRIKIKENENRNIYLDFARDFAWELKKQYIMKVIVINVVVGAF